jgi:hypothetical protein
MKRALATTAAGAVIVCQSFAVAAQTNAPAASQAGQSPGRDGAGAAASNGWGNAPAAGNGVRLAEPAREAPAAQRADAPEPPRHRVARRPRAKVAVASKPSEAAGCTRLPAQWSRAAQLAQDGKPDAAYGVYVALLHACSDPGELEGTAWKAAQALPSEYMKRLLADPAFDLPALRQARTGIALQQMYAQNAAGHDERALDYSRALRADPSVALDASALELSGWLELQAHDDRAAEPLFREAISSAKDPESARQGLALSLMREGRLEEAMAQSRQLTTPAGKRLDAQIALARAKASGNPAEVDAALARIDETGGAGDTATRATIGWALLSSKRAARAEDIFRTLHREAPENVEYAQGLAYAAAAAADYATLDALAAENRPGTPEVVREMLAEHAARRALYGQASAIAGHPVEGHERALQAVMTMDRKTGTAGQDKLTAWTIPQLSATLLTTPTLALGIDAALLRLDNGVRHAWGQQLGFSARTDWQDGELAAGATVELPGHAPARLLGKIQYQRYGENEASFIRFSVTRESLFDSLRAYEGVPGGPGPAISSSLGLTASTPLGDTPWHLAGSLAGGAVTATGTASNPFYAASLGVTRDFSLRGWSWLNAGPEFRVGSYRYDANRFDGPYAGYWSPKSNREAGLVFNAQTAEGAAFLFKTAGRVGYARRELFTGRASGAFGEDTATLAALVSPNLIVGAGIGYRASPGYHDMSVFAWLKLPLEARGHLRTADLVTPRGF